MSSPWDNRPPRRPRTGAPPPPRQGEPRQEPPHAGPSKRPPRDDAVPARRGAGEARAAGDTRGRHDTRTAGERSDQRRPHHAPDARAAAPREEVRVYGLNAVLAVHARRPQALRKLWLVEARIPALKRLLAWCVQHRVGYRVVAEDDLDRLAASSHHEGVVADVLKVEPLPLEAWLRALAPGTPALALWLDGVGNPHNFGAILRSAAHFGAAVLLPADSTLAVSGAAARVAEGGAEAVPLVRLPANASALAQLRGAGFRLAATVVRGGEDLFATAAPSRLVYVLGAEGEGMDAGLAAACDARLSIPGSGAVESLNVAAATAVFLAQWAARAK